jgi:hypothetical protein
MAVIKRIFTSTLIAATFVAGATVTTPAMAQWGGWGGPGWGYGGGYGGWGGGGYGYNGGAVAGAAIGGMALGAILGSAITQQSQNNYGYGYAPVRRARLCPGRQALYDEWGDFVGWQRVRVPC